MPNFKRGDKLGELRRIERRYDYARVLTDLSVSLVVHKVR